VGPAKTAEALEVKTRRCGLSSKFLWQLVRLLQRYYPL